MYKNETKKAVALKYDTQKDLAPKVVAKGSDLIAKSIIDIAKTHGVPIKKDADLVQMLSKIDIDQQIPPNLYKAVAEVFSFLYKITDDKRK